LDTNSTRKSPSPDRYAICFGRIGKKKKKKKRFLPPRFQTKKSIFTHSDCSHVHTKIPTNEQQVVIGGRNKYLINGHSAQLKRVQNLFRSVQLNVNNPHFLIMQGRITKVLNMKPPEILSMIEEAAGTKMFEDNKLSVLKTIEKKEKKVQEIQKVKEKEKSHTNTPSFALHSTHTRQQQILTEEITPTLENLRKERSHYLKWSNNQAEIERLSRFTVAHEYVRAQEILQRNSTDVSQMESKRDSLKEKLQELEKEVETINNKLNSLSEEKEKVRHPPSPKCVSNDPVFFFSSLPPFPLVQEMDKALKALEEKMNKHSKSFLESNTDLQHLKETLDAEKATFNKLKKSIKEVPPPLKANNLPVRAHTHSLSSSFLFFFLFSPEKIQENISQKRAELAKKMEVHGTSEASVKELSNTLEELQRRFQAVSAGLSGDEGRSSLADKERGKNKKREKKYKLLPPGSISTLFSPQKRCQT
jgi:chromosome segregation ATPase